MRRWTLAKHPNADGSLLSQQSIYLYIYICVCVPNRCRRLCPVNKVTNTVRSFTLLHVEFLLATSNCKQKLHVQQSETSDRVRHFVHWTKASAAIGIGNTRIYNTLLLDGQDQPVGIQEYSPDVIFSLSVTELRCDPVVGRLLK